MNKLAPDATELANGLKRRLDEVSNVDIVVCPPFTVLSEVSELVRESNIDLGAQNVYWEDEGAYTGEVSSPMLKDIGCKYVIIGHSERRALFGETNETVNKKVRAALTNGLSPIVCVGETLDEREAEKTFDVVKNHIENGLKDLSKEQILRIVIAYEPVWAIVTGKTATPEQAQEVHAFIRQLLTDIYGIDSSRVRIQYGGSVKPDNASVLMSQPDIDGALVGGASLNLDSFVEIVKASIPQNNAG